MTGDWKPHRGWPSHIVGMALAIADNKQDCFGPLQDALIDEGLEQFATALSSFGKFGTYSRALGEFRTNDYYIGIILNDGYVMFEEWPREVQAYLKKRTRKVP